MRDADLRAVLIGNLSRRFSGDPNTRIVEEMGIWSGSVRIDIAVINCELHGYELKSARDTLSRLDAQAVLYSQVFDRVTLVVAERHSDAAATAVPDWWGITIASLHHDAIKLQEVKPSQRNPSPDSLQLVRLLWRNELLTMLEQYGIDRGVRSSTVDIMARRAAAEIPSLSLAGEVRAALKSRIGWLRQSGSNKSQMSIDSDFNPGGTTT